MYAVMTFAFFIFSYFYYPFLSKCNIKFLKVICIISFAFEGLAVWKTYMRFLYNNAINKTKLNSGYYDQK